MNKPTQKHKYTNTICDQNKLMQDSQKTSEFSHENMFQLCSKAKKKVGSLPSFSPQFTVFLHLDQIVCCSQALPFGYPLQDHLSPSTSTIAFCPAWKEVQRYTSGPL